MTKRTAAKSSAPKLAGKNEGTVFLIHGRDLQARNEVCSFLEALGLKPITFSDERECARSAPTVLDVVQQGMERCQLVLALFTPDEWCLLRGDMREEGKDERDYRRWQARPNVMFEAGLAYSKDPERVVFLELGDVQLFSDVTGMHSFAPTNRSENGSARHSLYSWLKNWFSARGVEIRSGEAWKQEGDFESCAAPRARPLDAYSAPSAGWPWLERQAFDDLQESANGTRDIIGDCVELTAWTSARFSVRVEDPGCSDDLNGSFSSEQRAELIETWLTPYRDPAVGRLIERNITLEKMTGVNGAKLGLASFDGGADAMSAGPSITVRPINHLVTAAFNRGLALERLKKKSFDGELHQLWGEHLRRILSGQMQSLHFQCPSQLFLEVALITSDGFVPITQKHKLTSVYALRNSTQMVWTCGFELGPQWGRVATVDAADDESIAELDFHSAALEGLKNEYGLELSDEDAQHLRLKSLVLQTLHLNTAFLGYLVLPNTREEMLEACGRQRKGGLDHSRMYFTRFQDSDKHLAHEDSVAWHGTAMARFRIIEESEADVASELSRRFGTARA